jgi:putative ABC transport system ATP-binding protein
MRMSFLAAQHVWKSYRSGSRAEVHALADVCLTIARGRFVALTGPSGSGKTTLLAVLAALERPSRGQVLFDGHDLATFSDVALARVRRRTGFIFQDFSLIPSLPVWENITCALVPRGLSRSHRQQLARSLLARLGLAERFAAGPRELSGGEQQRVAVARALAGEPEVVFADEPTSNLDPATARDVLDLLKELHAEGKTLVVSTHDPHLAGLATEVHELRGGRLVSAS